VEVLKCDVELEDRTFVQDTAHRTVLLVCHLTDSLVLIISAGVLARLASVVTVEFPSTQLSTTAIVIYPTIRFPVLKKVELGVRRLGARENSKGGVEIPLTLLQFAMRETYSSGIGRAHFWEKLLTTLHLTHPTEDPTRRTELIVVSARMEMVRKQLAN
jgi:hypothetical protein